jgi:cell division control protein 45
MFDLAWKLNRDDKDLLWYAIIGLTEQLWFQKIDNTLYVLESGNLQAHATRLQNRSNDSDIETSLKITFVNDLRLVLYRHWSVAASLKYSMLTATKLKLWSIRGDKKLQEILADMG